MGWRDRGGREGNDGRVSRDDESPVRGHDEGEDGI